MNKNSIFLLLVGLFIGSFIGFYAANNINRQSILEQKSTSATQNVPGSNPQVQNASVKPSNQSAMMPEIAETLDKAEKEPENFEVQSKAGDMYAKIQRFSEAAKFYEKAHQIKPDDYQTIVKIGNTYFDSQDYLTAAKWYEQALAKNPDDINVRTDYGITFVEREDADLDRAVKEFQTSLKTNPKHEPTLYNLGIAYYKKGNLEETKKILNELQSINAQGHLANRLSEILSVP